MVKMKSPNGKATVLVLPQNVEHMENNGWTKADVKPKVSKPAGGAGKKTA